MATTINAATFGSGGVDTIVVARRPQVVRRDQGGGVIREALESDATDARILTLGNATLAEANALEAWLTRGVPVEVATTGYGTLNGVVDSFEAKIFGAANRGIAKLIFQVGTSDIDTNWTVATLANDFSITQSSAPWLRYATTTIQSGPAGYAAATSWTITAAGDGTTAVMTINRFTGNDGTYSIRAVA